MATQDTAVRSQRFKCDACGAELKFDAASNKLKCSHCGALRDVPVGTGNIVEYDFYSGLAAAQKGLGAGSRTRTSRCEDCGASVVFPEGVTSIKCSFCGSARVLAQEENENAIRPASLLPFSIESKRANQEFSTWIGKRWFRPNDLKRLARVEELAGIYVPFWTYDAHVESSWTAEAGYYYYETEEYTTQEGGQTVRKTRQVQRTRWERAWGHRSDEYDDVLVCASSGLPRALADRFSTFDTTQLVPYAPGYLAGWRAEEYGVDLEGGFQLAQQKMEAEQLKRCGNDVPGDTQRSLSVDNVFSGVTWKHVLLPVWVAAYRYRGKPFQFLVNGATGEVVGKAPYSFIKITLFVLSVILLALVVFYFLGRPHQ